MFYSQLNKIFRLPIHNYLKEKNKRAKTNLLRKLNLQMFYNRDREGFTYGVCAIHSEFHKWVPDHKLFVT